LASRPGQGAAVLEREGDAHFLRAYAASGSLLWRHALPSGLRCPGVLALSDDGEVLVGEFSLDLDARLHEVLAVSETQPLRWRTDLGALNLSGLSLSIDGAHDWPTRWLEVSGAELWAGVASQGGAGGIGDRVGRCGQVGQRGEVAHPVGIGMRVVDFADHGGHERHRVGFAMGQRADGLDQILHDKAFAVAPYFIGDLGTVKPCENRA
jgi:hypothetical protein